MESQVVRSLMTPRVKKATLRSLVTKEPLSQELEMLTLDDITAMIEKWILPLLDVARSSPAVVYQVSQTITELCTVSKVCVLFLRFLFFSY